MLRRRKNSIILSSAITALFIASNIASAIAPIQSIVRVSTDASGNQSTVGSSGPVLSENGRYIAFGANDGNLVAGDTNNASDVFVKDNQTGAISRVSTASDGSQAVGNTEYLMSGWSSISYDGRYIAFASNADNLVSDDTNNAQDIFVKDTQTGTTTRVSSDSNGMQSNGDSASTSNALSMDGRYIAFSSDATNLVQGDTNNRDDVFLKDTQTGALSRISTDSSGNQGDGSSYSTAAITPDGRYVVFSSDSTNLVADDTNNAQDIFVKDTQTGTTTRVSTDSNNNQLIIDGVEDAAFTGAPTISADGRYVSFTSDDSGLVSGDTNNKIDVFVKDTQTGTLTRASTDSAGTQANDHSTRPSISASGRFVTFNGSSTNLVAGNTNNFNNIFVKDIQTGEIVKMSVDSSGNQANGWSYSSVFSPDECNLVYISSAANIVSGDTNNVSDVFMVTMDNFAPKTYAKGAKAKRISKKKAPRYLKLYKFYREKAKTKNKKLRKRYRKAAKKNLIAYRNAKKELAIAKLKYKVEDPYAENNKANVTLKVEIKVDSKARAKKKANLMKQYKSYKLKAKKEKNKKLKKRYNKMAKSLLKRAKKVKVRFYKKAKTIKLGSTEINSWKTYEFKTKKPGSYKYYVYATDSVGNAQENIAEGSLVVQ